MQNLPLVFYVQIKTKSLILCRYIFFFRGLLFLGKINSLVREFRKFTQEHYRQPSLWNKKATSACYEYNDESNTLRQSSFLRSLTFNHNILFQKEYDCRDAKVTPKYYLKKTLGS